jgi:hypothetical protein
MARPTLFLLAKDNDQCDESTQGFMNVREESRQYKINDRNKSGDDHDVGSDTHLLGNTISEQTDQNT